MSYTSNEIDAALTNDILELYESLKLTEEAREVAHILIHRTIHSNFTSSSMNILEMLKCNPSLLKISQKQRIEDDFGSLSDNKQILLLAKLIDTQQLTTELIENQADHILHLSFNNLSVVVDLLAHKIDVTGQDLTTVEMHDKSDSSWLSHKISSFLLGMQERPILSPEFEQEVLCGRHSGIELLTHPQNPTSAKAICNHLLNYLSLVSVSKWSTDPDNQTLINCPAFKNGLIDTLSENNLERHFKCAIIIFDAMTDPTEVIEASWQNIIGQPVNEILDSCIWPLVTIDNLQHCKEQFNALQFNELLSHKLSVTLQSCDNNSQAPIEMELPTNSL
ncbi:hypothetical protein [Shewanella colwelliana]|uniref:hypothetical protein n=1 Tax=Shewanella colwelliana TaxID=23 RepID=UPI0022AFAE5A|nr:hypothetical protein [Shewanella colwelliana]MCZ4337822.1 hypothetical protein [Shewanella colwelliana]